MGCGTVRTNNSVRPIQDLTIEISNLPTADNIFQQAIELLSQIKSASASLNISLMSFKSLCKVQYLKDATLSDAVKVFMYCLAASTGGLEQVSFETSDYLPFMSINRKAVLNGHAGLADNWSSLIDRLTQATEICQRFLTAFGELVTAAEALDYNDLLTTSGFSVAEASKDLRAFQSNLLKLKKAPPLAQKISDQCAELWAEIRQVSIYLTTTEASNYMKGLFRRPLNEKGVDPELIVQKYWPDMSRVLNLTI